VHVSLWATGVSKDGLATHEYKGDMFIRNVGDHPAHTYSVLSQIDGGLGS